MILLVKSQEVEEVLHDDGYTAHAPLTALMEVVMEVLLEAEQTSGLLQGEKSTRKLFSVVLEVERSSCQNCRFSDVGRNCGK